MGNNQSINPTSSGFLFPNSNNNTINPYYNPGNLPDPTLFDNDSLVDDLSEEEFIGVTQSIIHKEEILRLIRGIALPVQKKPRNKTHSS